MRPSRPSKLLGPANPLPLFLPLRARSVTRMQDSFAPEPVQQAHRDPLGQVGAFGLHLVRCPGQDPNHMKARKAEVSSGQQAMASNCPALRQSEREDIWIPCIATQFPVSRAQQAGMAFEASSEGMKVTCPLHLTLPVEKSLHEERCQVAVIVSGGAPAARTTDSTNTRRPTWPTWPTTQQGGKAARQVV